MKGSVPEPRFTGEGHPGQNRDHGEGPMAVPVLQRSVEQLVLEPLKGRSLTGMGPVNCVGTPVEFAVN